MRGVVLPNNAAGRNWRLYEALGLDELPAETRYKLIPQKIEEYGRSILVKTWHYRSARNLQKNYVSSRKPNNPKESPFSKSGTRLWHENDTSKSRN